MSFLSTSHIDQHLIWPRLVYFIVIWGTYWRKNMRTSRWTTCIRQYQKCRTRRKDEGIANIPPLGPVQKNHLVIYKTQDGNEFFVHIPQWPTFNMTKAGLFYRDMRHLLKKKYAHITVNNLHPPIPKVQDKKKGCTARNIKRSDHTRRFQNITGQQTRQFIHAVDNKILKNLPILQEYVGMAVDIYGPSIPHPKWKTVRHNIKHVDPVKISTVPKTILHKYKEVTICCDLMHINRTILINII